MSAPAILVIAGTIPVVLLAAERTEIYKVKSAGRHITGHFREITITKWQRLWNDEDRGRWTVRLIADIRPWIGRKFGEVNYYLTQLLSGQGYFKKYGQNGVPLLSLCIHNWPLCINPSVKVTARLLTPLMLCAFNFIRE